MNNPNDWCVAWSNLSKTVHVAKEEQILNVNSTAVLDGQQGFAVFRRELTRDQAERVANAMQAMVNAKNEVAA